MGKEAQGGGGQLQIRLYRLWSSQSLLNPKIIWKNILQYQNFLRFEANISLISTGYVNVDSQTSLIVTAAEQFEVNYELLRV